MSDINISEFFYSIQGETRFSGLRTVFVRLSGCNLSCIYCDTKYALDSGTKVNVKDIFSKICVFSCNLVVITGGEPLLQPKVFELIHLLIQKGKTVLVETNGSLDIREVPKEAVRIMDVKCPGSGESEKNMITNLNFLNYKDEIKFVITSRADYEWAVNFIKSNELSSHNNIFSPVTSYLSPEKLADWILSDDVPVRLQLQLHKIIWGDEARGV